MNYTKFKKGNRVYCPVLGTKIYTLEANNKPEFPLIIKENGLDLTDYGQSFKTDAQPSIFLATEENRLLLNKLYNTEFSKQSSNIEVIKQYIDNKGLCLCLVDYDPIDKVPNIKDSKATIAIITSVVPEERQLLLHLPFKQNNGKCWKYAMPVEVLSDGSIIYLS